MKNLFFFLFTFVNIAACSPSKQNDEMTGGALPAESNGSVRVEQNFPEDPSQGTFSQAFGFYANGFLQNADVLPDAGKGYVKILRPRNRHFSSFDLNYVVQEIAENIRNSFPDGERMQVGDMSSERGGFLYGHASHQNGLDVDVAYFRQNHTEQDPSNINGYEESFVLNGKLTKNFDMARNWAFVKAAVGTGRTSRIFVNAAIKAAFCNHAKNIGEYSRESEFLRRLRAYEGHVDHFHLRIDCPLNSKECQPQEEVPPGAGC